MSSDAGGGAGRQQRRGGGVTALLVLTALALISLDLGSGRGSALDPLRAAVAGVLGPVERGIGAFAADAPGGLGVGTPGSGTASNAPTAALQAQVDALTAELRRTETDRRRAAELDALLRLAGAGQYRTVPALVVAVTPPEQSERTVTIDAGRADGVWTDMTVVNGHGLVGRVVATTSTTATVQLVIDPEAQLGVRVEGSLELGLARGDGTALGLELLDPLAPLAVSQRVVTFGSPLGRPYVAGVPVGELTGVRGDVGAATRTAVLTPYVDFSALDLVGVIVEPPRADPRDAVLPPRPGPSDTSTAGAR